MAGLLKVFQRQEDPKELVRKWQARIRAETRELDRQIRDINFEEKKVQKSIKEAAKRNDVGSLRALAKGIVKSRKSVTQLYVNKAQLLNLNNELSTQLAMTKVVGTLSKSTEVMKVVNSMIKLPQLQSTMAEMSREMMKAGLIGEMVNDAMDSAMDGEDMEEETEEQVEKVLAEIVGETMAQMPATKASPQKQPARAAVEDEEEERDEEMEALQARLNAVRT